METIEEIWFPIPGIPGYEVSNRLRFKSYMASKEGKIRNITNKRGYVSVSIKGRYTCLSVKRLYIAAKNNLSPYELDRAVFVKGTAECPVFVTRSDDAKATMAKRKEIHHSVEEVLACFEQARKELDILIDYYRTGNIESVSYLLLGCKSNIINYLLNTKKVFCMDSAEEVWSQVMALYIDGLMNRKMTAASVSNYLRAIARRVVCKRISEKKKNRQYIDEFDYFKQVRQW